MKRLTSLLLLVLIGLPLSLTAAEYHVSVSGSDLKGTGAADDPFASIQHAIETAADGDTVWVEPGAYLENIDFSGKDLLVQAIDGPELTFVKPLDPTLPVVTFASGESRLCLLDGFSVLYTTDAPGILCDGASPI
ncbi:MAG: hypothetical protein JXA92_10760, partial [candidate division Zixibacteria bacterium]|nr:hypothetical protein [candidate division Zixibacteria bacterium]